MDKQLSVVAERLAKVLRKYSPRLSPRLPAVRALLERPLDELPFEVLRPGNDKLGNQILTFGLPAVVSCPGRTELCERLCYACHYHYKQGNVVKTRMRNLVLACRDDFDELVLGELRRKRQRLVRPHDSGDLFSAAYAEAWYRVMAATSATHRHFLFSRSWRVEGVDAVLSRMSRLPNVRVWYSVDREGGWPGYVPAGVRLAYLQSSEDDVPSRGVDLVFRDYKARRNAAKRVGGALVCPYENGFTRDPYDPEDGFDCVRCGLCWSPLEGAMDPRSHHDNRVRGTGRLGLKLVPAVV